MYCISREMNPYGVKIMTDSERDFADRMKATADQLAQDIANGESKFIILEGRKELNRLIALAK